MATAQRIEKGDTVEFIGRNRKVRGVVAKVRMRHVKGKKRALALAVTGDENALDRLVAEVAPNDGAGVWTVGYDSLKLISKGTRETRDAAEDHVQGFKSRVRQQRQEVSSRHFGESNDAGLLDLKIGDAVEIKFRDRYGWELAVFKGFVPGSGNVRFEYYGRVRTTAPKFVRIPQPKAV